MPTLSADEAIERLAAGVENAAAAVLAEIRSDNLPDHRPNGPSSAADLARRVRDRLEADEIVDLWNVIFPAHRDVWYDEETSELHYEERAPDYADVD